MVLNNLQNQIKRAGGLRNYLSNWFRSNFKPLWDLLQHIPVFKEWLNKFNISQFVAKFQETVPRIPNYTLKHDYPTMDVLYDESRTTYSRLLPRVDPEWTAQLPEPEVAASLFLRDEFTPETNRNLTVLISYYAQWFTHQFLNTNPENPIEANMPLGINLSMMYGSTMKVERDIRSGVDGLLKATMRNGKEYPEILDIDENTGRFMPGQKMFRMPISRANMVPGFAAIHILFFRRHQFVARQLKKWAIENNRVMDDEELFQKTKLIMAITVLKITMHDYVARALQSSHLKIRFDQQVKQSRIWKWFGPSNFPPSNSIQVEFNFLYRWHQLVPDTTKIVKKLPALNEHTVYDIDQYPCDELYFPPAGSDDVMNKIRAAANSKKNVVLEEDGDKMKTFLPEDWNSVSRIVDDEDGLERVIFSASTQRAGKLELMNSNEFLVKNVILPGIKKNREYGIASYNDYREYFGFGRLSRFDEITSNVKLQERLKSVYKTVDNIEYYAGVFSEDKDLGGVHGPLLASIGTAMTFCAIHASRLFEADIINEEALTPRGLELIEEINYISDLTEKHTELQKARIRFTMPEDARVPSTPNASVTGIRSAKNLAHEHQE